MKLPLHFPDGFLWGTAAAGHQVEGGNVHSNWWAWEQLGLVNDGSRSGRAVDYWNRFAEDHRLMRELGFGVHRLGVEWARIEPEAGRFDAEALARYRAIVEDVRANGMRVCLTLNHWVLPEWFAAGGGWLRPDALPRWRRFVSRVAAELGDLVDLWVTLNEPMVPVLAGYVAGHHPPCQRNPWNAARVFDRLLRAHALAYRLLHDEVKRTPDGGPPQVGFAGAYQLVEPWHASGPARWLEEPVARFVARASFGAWDRSLVTGRVATPWGLGARVPGLAGSLDWVGVNYYMRISVRLDPATLSNVKAGGYAIPPGIETSDMGWQIYPPGFHAVLMRTWRTFRKPVYVTENGCADTGDERRRRYLVSHLAQLQRAIRHGADVRGYMLWTFTDNFEWREGFAKKFGIVAVDPADPDLVRRPRPSAELMGRIARANAIEEKTVEELAPGALAGWPLE